MLPPLPLAKAFFNSPYVVAELPVHKKDVTAVYGDQIVFNVGFNQH